jgi:hypothetical protein
VLKFFDCSGWVEAIKIEFGNFASRKHDGKNRFLSFQPGFWIDRFCTGRDQKHIYGQDREDLSRDAKRTAAEVVGIYLLEASFGHGFNG